LRADKAQSPPRCVGKCRRPVHPQPQPKRLFVARRGLVLALRETTSPQYIWRQKMGQGARFPLL
jgi:hypothetical protein